MGAQAGVDHPGRRLDTTRGFCRRGLAPLQARVAKLPTDSAIVIYCGCCPWRKCPNIAAAYDALLARGFKNVKVIYFADDFGTNWVDQGYPTTKGS